ncbi:MAG: IS1634 family transposase [Dehalococcoidales bacterium]|nr:IS1634 family transposase [Dehalococcoidales bacterium]
MFVRVKNAGQYRYLQVVENHREGKRTVQRVLCTLGKVDELVSSGATDSLLRSLSRFGQQVRVMEKGDLEKGPSQQLGPDLVFSRLWQNMGVGRILRDLVQSRSFEFPVERAIYLTVLHRLFMPGSDRAAARWRRDVVIPGTEGIELHHLYRAMRWLGEVKDEVEEALFAGWRDLFSELSLAFFDTTSIYFEGRGGESLGQYGHSKDHRPDLKQMVVGAVLTGEGRPVCCELWPGNHADSTALLPAVDRLRQRFGLKRVCWVADRGMISEATIGGLEERKLEYILGARMRRQKEVAQSVLGRAGRYEEVAENLRVKEVRVDGRRYIVCHNPQEAVKDAADRESIILALEDELKQGMRQLVGNRGYRRFLRVEKDAVSIDRKRVEAEARYDGKFVLRTNTGLPASEVAVQYKRLLLVEQFFRTTKSLLETRPIFHQWDSTIRGHVFCSFLALVLMDELKRRLLEKGLKIEWDMIRQDLEALEQAPVREGDHWYLLRSPLQGVAGKVLQSVGVAPPPPVVPIENVVPNP